MPNPRLALLLLCAAPALTAAPPEMSKGRAAHRWIGHSINPVRLLPGPHPLA